MKSPQILVVDDETTIRFVLKKTLGMRGCDIREAGSAEEALELLADWEADVALLDIAMPGKSGLELLEEIKRIAPDTEVLIMTSYASVETVQRALRGGAHDFLSKPFTIHEIWPTVEKALTKRRAALDRSAVAETATRLAKAE